MGRFHASLPVSSPPASAPAPAWNSPAASPVNPPLNPLPGPTLATPQLLPSTSIASQVGLLALVLFWLSPLLNDLTMLTLGGIKLYIAPLSYAFLVLMVAASGMAFSFFQHPAGKGWLIFCLWMIAATPFSIWPGGSFGLVKDFLWRAAVLVMFIPAVVVTLPQLQRLIGSIATWSAIILLATCFLHGQSDESGRFHIPESLFYRGANDLAIALDLIIAGLLYKILRGQSFSRLFHAALFGLSIYFLIKTGSRGAFLGLVAIGLVIFIFSRYRAFMMLMAVLGILMIPLLPSHTIARLTSIVYNPSEKLQQATSADEAANIASQMQRQHLFWKSLEFTFTKPIFGVGPGQFIEALWGKAVETQQHEAALGTHNTYTQVSSETGLPGIIAFVAVIVICIRTSYRVYRRTMNIPALEELSILALVQLAMLTSYAVNIAFHHLGYSGVLSLLIGQTIVLANVATALLRSGVSEEVRVASHATVPSR